MTRKISALTARTQLGQIMDRAVEHSERFLVERNGEPAVLILSVSDFVKTLTPPPDWLEKSWDSARRRGLDRLSAREIGAEIAGARREARGRVTKRGPRR
ncbi:MAG TPA: type II toxin-antitoxin system Phd/YefM family antitoxin [Bryobacteraceae bacterium]|nr:type II toxin-antitoxin system Phd/YefM family antitoxin [Bryobacteraceae bacterium]